MSDFTVAMSLAPLAIIARMNTAPTIAEEAAAVPLGIDLGGSGPVTASPEPRALAAAAVMDETHGAQPATHRRNADGARTRK